MVEGISMHEEEDVLGADLVAAHLLRCPRRVACDALLICCQNVTGAPKLRVTAINFLVGSMPSQLDAIAPSLPCLPDTLLAPK